MLFQMRFGLLTPRKTGIVWVIVAKSDEIGKIATLVSCKISRDFAYGHHKGELDLISVQNTSFFYNLLRFRHF